MIEDVLRHAVPNRVGVLTRRCRRWFTDDPPRGVSSERNKPTSLLSAARRPDRRPATVVPPERVARAPVRDTQATGGSSSDRSRRLPSRRSRRPALDGPGLGLVSSPGGGDTGPGAGSASRRAHRHRRGLALGGRDGGGRDGGGRRRAGGGLGAEPTPGHERRRVLPRLRVHEPERRRDRRLDPRRRHGHGRCAPPRRAARRVVARRSTSDRGTWPGSP